MRCPKRPSCFDKAGIRRRVLASELLSGIFQRAPARGNSEYLAMMRLRKIWAEGSFSVLKQEHCISRIRKGHSCSYGRMPRLPHGPKPQENGKCHLSLSPNLLFCWNHCGFQQFLFLSTGPLLYLIRYFVCIAQSKFEKT